MPEYPAKSWMDTFRLILSTKVLVILMLGFSAGIPYFLIFSSLSLWLKEAGIDRSTIGFLSWAALGYSFKFVWAPLVDQLQIPGLTTLLGRRRSWLLLSQIWVVASILLMAFTDPAENLTLITLGAVSLGFAAATQDIVIDAFRIEFADSKLQTTLSSAYIAGYRAGMLIGGAGALYISEWFSGDGYTPSAWTLAYACMAGVMLVGIATTLKIKEPVVLGGRPLVSATGAVRLLLGFIICAAAFAGSFVVLGEVFSGTSDSLNPLLQNKAVTGFLVESVRFIISIFCVYFIAKIIIWMGVVPQKLVTSSYIDPIADFFSRYGRSAILVLSLIALYRMSDIVMGVIANIFYYEQGYSKGEIASISKVYGLFAILFGGFIGGAFSIRYGVYRALLVGAILSSLTNILFSILAGAKANIVLLSVAITADNLCGGMATAAFIAYLSSLTSVSFTAMQYAIFSSLMTLFPKLIAGYSGMMSISLGYQNFFYLTALMGIPAVILVLVLQKVLPISEGSASGSGES